MNIALGAIFARAGGDTLLVQLHTPDSMAAVPVVYTLASGAKASRGSRMTAEVWLDTLDLSGNKVQTVTVTAPGGQKHSYAIAFEYVIENAGLPLDGRHALAIFFDNNTMYVGTNQGMLKSTDGGLTFTDVNIPSLGYGAVYGVYARGNLVYAATDSGVAVSSDGGNSFFMRVLKAPLPSGVYFPVSQVCAQGDTVYAASDAGVYISHDAGNSFDSSANNFLSDGGFPGIWSIYAMGSTVYAGGQEGFYISTDGGRHFTGYAPLNSGRRCNSIYLADGLIYAGTIAGVSISGDGARDFSDPSAGGQWPSTNTYAVAASGSTVCAGGTGFWLSQDGGKTYAQYTAASGLGGQPGNYLTVNAVAINGGVIYCGYQQYISRLTPR